MSVLYFRFLKTLQTNAKWNYHMTLQSHFWNISGEYFNSKRPNCVLQLIDSRHDLHDNDKQMINFLSETKIKFYIILTKIDKLKNSQYEQFYLNLKSQISIISQNYSEIIRVSAKTGLNINKIRSLIISEAKNSR